MTTSVVWSLTSTSAPPMTPARPMIFPPLPPHPRSVMSRSSASSCALDIVKRRELLAGSGAADDDLVAEQRRVVRVQRLAEFEHDVVRHVDGQADRAHARLLQATLHPERGLRLRVQPGDLKGGELVTAGHLVDGVGILDDDGEPIIGGSVHREPPRRCRCR
jgi:hypothetical protein